MAWPGKAEAAAQGNEGASYLGPGLLLLSLSLFLSLSLTRRPLALLLRDEETQLSPATALDRDRTQASTVPTSASGADVTPKECDLGVHQPYPPPRAPPSQPFVSVLLC